MYKYKLYFQLWCSASTSGYVYNFYPYPGPAEKETSSYNFGSSSNVVYFLALKLREKFPTQDMHITMDSYFTSLALLDALKTNLNISATGTIRTNRINDFPIDVNNMEKNHQRGTYDYRF